MRHHLTRADLDSPLARKLLRESDCVAAVDELGGGPAFEVWKSTGQPRRMVNVLLDITNDDEMDQLEDAVRRSKAARPRVWRRIPA